jgi:hypothetical protein
VAPKGSQSCSASSRSAGKRSNSAITVSPQAGRLARPWGGVYRLDEQGTAPTSRPYPKRSGPTSLLDWSAVTVRTGLANQQRMPRGAM